MSYTTITLDDYFDDGIFNSLNRAFPDNGIGLGFTPLDVRRATSTPTELQSIAILSLTTAGSGSVIENLGRAGDGTLVNGAWGSDNTTHQYLTSNPKIAYSKHSSMVVGEVFHASTNFNDMFSGTLRFRFTSAPSDPVWLFLWPSHDGSHYPIRMSATQQQLIVGRMWIPHVAGTPTKKKGSGDGGPSAVVNQDINIDTDGRLFDLNTWVTAGFRAQAGALTLYLNGEMVKHTRMETRLNAGELADTLIVGDDNFPGDIDVIIWNGGTSTHGLIHATFPQKGTWQSPTIDLGGIYIFDRLTRAGRLNDDHTAKMDIYLSDTVDFLNPEKITNLDLNQEFQDLSDRKIYPRRDWIHGRYLRVKLTLENQTSLCVVRPYLSNIQMRFRSWE